MPCLMQCLINRMVKCYLIANIRVDEGKALQSLMDGVPAAVSRFRGRILVLINRPDLRKGSKDKDGRTLLIEFDDLTTAMKFYESSDYQKTFKLPKGFSVTDIQIVEALPDQTVPISKIIDEPPSKEKVTSQSDDDLVDLYRHHSRKEGIEGG